MDFLKELFEKAENGVLSYSQFKDATKEMKLVDLNLGDYVSKKKFEDELSTKDTQIGKLNETITARDTDLADLKKKLENAGTDATKLGTLSADFENLQAKYETDTKALQSQLEKQAYEFAVKEFANGKKFTSNAAKRDFVNSMIAENLKMKKDTIIGAEDFVNVYSQDNADAFVVETDSKPEEVPSPKPDPKFVSPTPGEQPKDDITGGFLSAFNFTGVRPKE